jgi:hypothetical protein
MPRSLPAALGLALAFCAGAATPPSAPAPRGVEAAPPRAETPASPPGPWRPTVEDRLRITFLTEASQRFLAGCRVTASDGTTLFTPDGRAHYAALWTRDFAYMVENARHLMAPAQVEGCIRYLLRGQRADGAIPDRVRPDGVPVFAAGSEDHPLGEPNLDNPQFLVIAADEYLRSLEPRRAETLFRQWSARLDAGLDYLPRGEHGLVFNDPRQPHSPYGFTDTVGKTGELLMESLLYWTACRRLAHWHHEAGSRARVKDYRKRAEAIEKGLGTLWDEDAGMFRAATVHCRQIDIWANAYALCLDFPLGPKRARMRRFLAANYERCVWRGQVRHLLKGEYWERLLTPVAPERYQNGAYWATASGWFMLALAEENPQLAHRMFVDLVADLQTEGICECVNEGYRQLETYVVSATNPLSAASRLYGLGKR